MRKLFTVALIAAVAMIGVVVAPKQGEAVPSFARQMNLPCFACHYQHIPKLNAFGRSFKLGGYTDAAVDLIEDELISLPNNIPASFVAKERYRVDTKTTAGTPKAGTERGQWDVYDEAALWLAGRAGSNIGYAVEKPAEVVNFKVIFSGNVGDTRLGVIPFVTDAAGPFWGMDISNTGVQPANKSWEHAGETNASTALGFTKDLAVTGITLYASNSMGLAAVGLWGPTNGNPDTGFDLSLSYRLAVTPNLGGFDTVIGVFGVTGKTKCVECGAVGAALAGATSLPNGITAGSDGVVEVKTEAMGVDAQAQGDIAGMSLEVQLQYATVGASDSLFAKADAFSVNAELGFSKALGLGLGYLNKTDKSGAKDVKDSATTVGIYWNIAQNVMLQPQYTIYGDDKSAGRDNRMTVLLFMGF